MHSFVDARARLVYYLAMADDIEPGMDEHPAGGYTAGRQMFDVDSPYLQLGLSVVSRLEGQVILSTSGLRYWMMHCRSGFRSLLGARC